MTQLLEKIREHCTTCAEDLGAVAAALLSVEDKLDYTMQYELEWLLSRYVIRRAKMEPEGLASILNRFPIPTSASESDVQESLHEITMNIRSKLQKLDLPQEVKQCIDDFANNAAKLDISFGSISLTDVPNEPDKKEAGPEDFRESISIIKLAHKDSKKTVYRTRMIQSGHTLSGRYFSDDVLKEAIPLFEGTRSYANHPNEEFRGGDRPVESLVGWFSDVELKEGDGLYADWHVLSNSGFPYLKDQLEELAEAGKLDLIGLSLLGTGKSTITRKDGKMVKMSESINSVRSVDLVDVPGAGGNIQNLVLSDREEIMGELKLLESMTLEELKQARPDLFAEAGHTDDEDDDDKKETTASAKKKKKKEEDDEAAKVKESAAKEEALKMSSVTGIELRLSLRESKLIIDEKLSESFLPDAMVSDIRESYSGIIVDEDELDKKIKMYRNSAAQIAPYGGNFHLPHNASLITEEDKFQCAMDRLFGVEQDSDKGIDPGIKFEGIRQAYVLATGDYDFNWGSIPIERIREALPTAAKVVGGGTITFANVLGTSINRRLLRSYMRQRMWWEPIVEIGTINNLKVQDRNRLKSFGALTERTTGGAEYTELTWAENKETYTPTEFGNIVPIAQRAIVNDDLNALTSAADEMGRSAGITLNEYVGNLFTQNSGAGPAMADSNNVFDNANHQGNSLTVSLSRASYKTADQVIRKFNDDSSKRIGLQSAYLLHPAELRETALQIERSEKVPDSANNATNIFAGEFKSIEVPQFSDNNNWYLLTSNDQHQYLEMGFLNGRREPELMVQANPMMGMMFTHDVLSYKIRQRYGGGWVDFRGAVASLVG